MYYHFIDQTFIKVTFHIKTGLILKKFLFKNLRSWDFCKKCLL